MTADPILSVRDLSVAVSTPEGSRDIVDRVSFELGKGEILGLVGESGSGKSMTCRALIRLLPGSRLAITGGAIELAGRDLVQLGEKDMRRVRGGSIGMIFQNPSSHLDPVMTIGRQITESIRYHQSVSGREARQKAIEVLRQVGIPDPATRIDAYPHEFSGGMRQRAMIAVALACDPDVLIADEPTTALDVTVQAQILRLLLDLRDRRGVSIILITHDLGVVAQSCESVAVMYGGRICERGPRSGRSSATAITPTPRASLPASRRRGIPASECAPSPASRRASFPCRPAAASIRAVRTPAPTAGRASRRSRRTVPRISSPATIR